MVHKLTGETIQISQMAVLEKYVFVQWKDDDVKKL